ncbi:alanine racemase [Tsukamurella tyrosinosolvens]|uniref:alanine racemase n=1 Tax=Tsukamurella tyrosinosolvens TaxID=57704 RepID=UPI001CE149CE|nr:alanine racemase [Tsukamurella tyrosinosolvens]MCA4994224.1 alanine racemase [Tsukamurella tyrosinosolvens]
MSPATIDPDTFEITGAALSRVIGSDLDDEMAPQKATGISLHSADTVPGDVFFAFKGAFSDGHDWVHEALARGASFVIAERMPECVSREDSKKILLVDDTLDSLIALSTLWRAKLRARVVLVVGDSRASLVKEALTDLLIAGGATVYASPEGFRTRLGAAVSLLRCPQYVDFLLIESDPSRTGDGELIGRIIQPDLIALTDTDFNESQQDPEVLRLARAAFADTDPPHFEAVKAGAVVCRPGLDTPPMPFSAYSVSISGKGNCVVKARDATGVAIEYELPLQCRSRDSASALIFAVEVAVLLGVSLGRARSAIVQHVPMDQRFEIWNTPSGVTLIRDQVHIDPISVRRALRTFNAYADTMQGQLHGVVGGSKTGTRYAIFDLRDLHENNLPGRSIERAVVTIAGEGVDHACLLTNSEIVTDREFSNITVTTSIDDVQHMAASAKWGDVLYVSTPDNQDIEDLASVFLTAMSANRMYIDLERIADNFRKIQERVGSATVVMPMVKALCYGTDNYSVINALRVAGADVFAVSSVDEGVKLRRSGLPTQVLVMLPTAGELEKAVSNRLTPVVYSLRILEHLSKLSSSSPYQIDFHLEVDTGMNRTGVSPSEIDEVLAMLSQSPNLRMTGLMTHFACADEPEQDALLTRRQLDLFEEARAKVKPLMGEGFTCHAANTAAALRIPEARFDMVRVGIGLHGVNPTPDVEIDLSPAVSLVSKIAELSVVQHDEAIGYGGTYVANSDMTVAVVAIGYHDGVPRVASNKGKVVVRGIECPILGRVSMDSMMIDVTGLDRAQEGDDVLIYGDHGNNLLDVSSIAKAGDTIPYEIFARVAPRVQRIAVANGLERLPLRSVDG